jgi:hypothetical protein
MTTPQTSGNDNQYQRNASLDNSEKLLSLLPKLGNLLQLD